MEKHIQQSILFLLLLSGSAYGAQPTSGQREKATHDLVNALPDDTKAMTNAILNGADVNFADPGSSSIKTLFDAYIDYAHNIDMPLVELFLQHGAKISTDTLKYAALRNTPQALFRLLKSKPNFMEGNKDWYENNNSTPFDLDYFFDAPYIQSQNFSILLSHVTNPQDIGKLQKLKESYIERKNLLTEGKVRRFYQPGIPKISQATLANLDRCIQLLSNKISQLNHLPIVGTQIPRELEDIIAAYKHEEDDDKQAGAEAQDRWNHWQKSIEKQIQAIERLYKRIPFNQEQDSNKAIKMRMQLETGPEALKNIPQPKTPDEIDETIKQYWPKLQQIIDELAVLEHKYPAKAKKK